LYNSKDIISLMSESDTGDYEGERIKIEGDVIKNNLFYKTL
tara:strand:+ start:2343 stop:2465 length:123 start_codon:yes stop_codon:yes gene_type:complete